MTIWWGFNWNSITCLWMLSGKPPQIQSQVGLSIDPAMRFAAPWLDHNRGWRSHHQPALTAVQNESIIGGLFLLWSTNCNLLHWVSSCKMWLPPSKTTTTTTETVIYECYGFAYCEYNCGQQRRRLNESTQDAEKSREREKCSCEIIDFLINIASIQFLRHVLVCSSCSSTLKSKLRLPGYKYQPPTTKNIFNANLNNLLIHSPLNSFFFIANRRS